MLWLNSQCFRWLNSYLTFFPLTQLVPHMFRVSMSSKHVIWESCYLNFRGLVLGCIEAKFCKTLCVGNGHPYLMQYMGRVDVLPALARATCSLAQENNSFFGLKFKPKKDRQNEAWNSWISWNSLKTSRLNPAWEKSKVETRHFRCGTNPAWEKGKVEN